MGMPPSQEEEDRPFWELPHFQARPRSSSREDRHSIQPSSGTSQAEHQTTTDTTLLRPQRTASSSTSVCAMSSQGTPRREDRPCRLPRRDRDKGIAAPRRSRSQCQSTSRTFRTCRPSEAPSPQDRRPARLWAPTPWATTDSLSSHRLAGSMGTAARDPSPPGEPGPLRAS